MPIDHLKNIAKSAPRHDNILGLDVGKKTIGLALGTIEQGIATPLHTIKRQKFSKDILVLKEVIDEYDVKALVIGLPYNMDGSEGPRAQSIRDFVLELKQRKDIVGPNPWIGYWDERLSTVSVEESVDTFVEKRKTKINSKASGLIDKLAAQVILQGALDYLRGM